MKKEKEEFNLNIFEENFKMRQEILHIPIVDGNDQLLGVFSERDLIEIPFDDKKVFDREALTPANKEKYFSIN